MFGAHPLSHFQGTPVKELLKEMRKGEAYKNREAERDEMTKKCQEIFTPPGIIL
jgi:hypothetical protein